MPQDTGASANADQALVSDGAQEVSTLPGFDPSREAAFAKCVATVAFYAIPENWHGVYMLGHGPMLDDWCDVEDDQYPDGKPGKMARETINWLLEQGFGDEAIATEAHRAETENTGSVHEGAGPKDIAHD